MASTATTQPTASATHVPVDAAATARALSLRAALATSSLTGLAFGLAAPPSSVGWLAWIALAPLLFCLRARAWSLRDAALIGGASGMGVGLVGFPWIAALLAQMGGLPSPLAWVGMVGYAAWVAVPFALFACATSLVRAGGVAWGLWCTVVFAAAIETWPVVFPYTPMIGLTAFPAWIQLAELGGTRSVEMPAMWVSLCVAVACAAGAAARRAAAALCAALIPALLFLVGDLRMRQIDAMTEGAPRVRVGLVQPNTPVIFGDPDEAMQRLREASAVAQAAGAQVVVWPEAGTYPFAMMRPVLRDSDLPRSRILASHDTPTIVGIVTFDPESRSPYNTLAHIAPDGTVRGTYDKTRRVMFGEYIPFVDPDWLTQYIANISHLHAGAGPAAFEVDYAPQRRVRVGPLICLEDILADFARDVARQDGGVELFVNTTIDAWYGDSAEPWEHLALAQLRSVEHRIPMARAVSTGVSAVIDATGRIRPSALTPKVPPPGERPIAPAEMLIEDIPLARSTADLPTVFARVGWTLPALCQIAVVTVLTITWLRRRSSTSRLD
jgi:apolipoprotein N-acyltransferase